MKCAAFFRLGGAPGSRGYFFEGSDVTLLRGICGGCGGLYRAGEEIQGEDKKLISTVLQFLEKVIRLMGK